MSEAPYNRYRDALRSGHLAGLRGANDEAVHAYREAARVLPERAAPHAALGKAYLAIGRPAEALTSFEAALSRAPDDAAALDGAARALLELDRPDDAAGLLDRLATIHLDHDRQVDALATIERAMEIAGSPWRRMLLERLRGGEAERPGPALTWLGDLPETLGELQPARSARDRVPEPIPDDLRSIAERVEASRRGDDVPGLLAGARALAGADRLRAAVDACLDALSVAPADPAVHRALATIYRRRGWQRAARLKLRIVERYQRVVDDPDELDREAESALVTGDLDELIRVVEEHADNGRTTAALDLLSSALGAAPGEPRLHLAIARIHLALGWRTRAVGELDRLARLVDVAGDEASRDAVVAFVNDLLRSPVGQAAPAD